MSLKNKNPKTIYFWWSNQQVISEDFVRYMETIYLANIDRNGSSTIDQYIQPWNVRNQTLQPPQGNLNKRQKKLLEAKLLDQKTANQEKMLGQLSLKETNEILHLTSQENKYLKNMHTLKFNDINFEIMGNLSNTKRYISLGNQIQINSMKNVFFTEPFFYYNEQLGSNIIDFTNAVKEET